MLETLVSLPFIKSYLGISDETKYDELIITLMPHFASLIEELLGLNQPEDITNAVKDAYCAKFGCHLQKTDSKFNRPIKSYKANYIEKEYSDHSEEVGDWCTTYNDALNDAIGENGLSMGTARRHGVYDEYSGYN